MFISRIVAVAIVFLSVTFGVSLGQGVGINEDNSDPDASALLDVKSSTKGILIPRMTSSQRTAIGSPAKGLLVFDNDSNSFWFFNGASWQEIGAGTGTDDQQISLSGTILTLEDGGSIDIGTVITDNQQLTLAGTILEIEDGNTVDLAAINTDGQLLSYNSTTGELTISDGNTIVLPVTTGGDNWGSQIVQTDGTTLTGNGTSANPLTVSGDLTDDQDISLSGTQLSITDGSTIDLAGIDTDEQTLTIAGTDLSISNGNTVDLSAIDTDTDDQTLSYDNTTGNLTISEGNTVTLPVSTGGDNWGSQVTQTDGATITGDGTLANPLMVNGDLTDDQDISLSGTQLSITNGSTIDLAGIDTDTDDQTLTLTGTDLGISEGNTVDLSGLQDGTGTDDQQLTLTGTNLSIEDGNAVDLSGINTDSQTLALTGTDLSIADGNTVDLSSLQDGTGTDDQRLTLTGTNLSIEDGNTIDMSAIDTDTDDQTLTLAGTDLSISEGNTVDLSGLQDGTGTDDQQLTLTGTSLSIEDGNAVDLSAINTDSQTLTLTGTDLSIADGNTVDLSSLQDGAGTDDQVIDAFFLNGKNLELSLEDDGEPNRIVDLSSIDTDTDDQTLSLSGTDLTIEDGNTIDLSSINTDDQTIDVFQFDGTNLEISLENDGVTNYSVDLSSLSDTHNKIEDADADTKIQVEESPDEDKIRFDVAGTEVVTIDNNGNVGIGVSSPGSKLHVTTGRSATESLTIDQGSGGSFFTGGEESTWQSFTATASGELTKVSLGHTTITTPDNKYIKIYEGEGTGGTLLFTSPSTIEVGAGGWYDFVVGGVELVEGQQYTIWLDDKRKWLHSNGNPYAGGHSSRSASADQRFRVYMMTDYSGFLVGDGGVTINDYTLPASDGAAGQVIASDGSGTTHWADVLDDQTLSLSGTDLTIEDGNTIDLSSINTDDQTIDVFQFDGTNLEISLENDGVANYSVDLSSLSDTYNKIEDADADTKIQVEKSTDEDIIRFDVAGKEQFTMNGATLETKNSGQSVFIGEGAGQNDDGTNNFQVFIGYQSGAATTAGYNNTAVGWKTLTNNNGVKNSAFGNSVLLNNTTGYSNTALGYLSMFTNTSGFGNVSVGESSLRLNETGNYNLALGYQAGYSSLGSNNIFIGTNAGYNETGSDKLYIENSSSSTPLIYGNFAQDSVKIYGTFGIADAYAFPTADGVNGQVLSTDGAGNAIWKDITAVTFTDSDNDTKIQVEESADEDYIRFDVAGNEAVVINNSSQVGIGTSQPSQLLEIKSQSNGLNTPLLIRNHDGTETGGNAVGIGFHNETATGRTPKGAIVMERNGSYGRGDFHFLLENTNSAQGATLTDAKMTITKEGNVGIGEIDPQESLHVAGNIRMVDGNEAVGKVMVSDVDGTATWTDPTLVGTDDQTVDNFSLSGNTLSLSLENDGVADHTVDLSGLSVKSLSDADNDTKIQVEESPDEDKIRFDVAGTEAVIIDNNGNVGVGVSSPGSKLHVNTGRSSTETLTIDQGSGSSFFTGGEESSWQSFTATASGELTKVSLGHSTITSPDNKYIRIYEGEGTGGTLLFTSPSAVEVGAAGWYDFVVGGVELVEGQQYTIWLDDKRKWFHANGDPYAGGRSSKSASADQKFRVYAMTDFSGFQVGSGGVTINDYTLPAADGAAGQVIASDGSGTTHWADVLDDQTLSLSGTDLTIEDGNTIDLSSINTDDQTIDVFQFDGTNLEISLENDGVANYSVDLSSLSDTHNRIEDADADTKIQVEKSADEDIIRFDNGGKETMVLDADGNLTLNRTANASQTKTLNISGARNLGSGIFGKISFNNYDITAGAFDYEGASITARNLGSADNGALEFWTRDDALRQRVLIGQTGILTIDPEEYGTGGLEINGSFNLNNGTQADGYVLVSDADGNASWATESQTLSLSGTNLTIANGNTISLGSINTDNQTLSLSGTNLSLTNGGSVNLSGLADDLGDHTATQNIRLNNQRLSNDGDNEGLQINDAGWATFSSGITTGGNVNLSNSGQGFQLLMNPSGNYVQIDVGGSGHSSDGIYIGDRTATANEVIIMGQVGIGKDILGGGTYQLEVSGDAAKNTGSSWTTTSDARLKQNIVTYEEGLDEVMQINPKTFHYNELSGYDTTQQHVGVIAQDLLKIVPYMVNTFVHPKNGETYYTVNNSAMTYMLINAVKELKEENEALKAKLAETAGLESRLAKIEAMLDMKDTTISSSTTVSEEKP